MLFLNLNIKEKHLLKQFKWKFPGFSGKATSKSQFIIDELCIKFDSAPLCFPDKTVKELWGTGADCGFFLIFKMNVSLGVNLLGQQKAGEEKAHIKTPKEHLSLLSSFLPLKL